MTLIARPDTRLLVIDANVARLESTSAALASIGASVLTATTVPQAMTVLREHAPDLALVEARVGDIDGVAIAGALRQEPREDEKLPILMLADSAPDARALARAGEAGVVDVVLRPVEPHILVNKVGLVLRFQSERRRLRADLARIERLQHANEQMVAGLIHDLRTPLMAINLSAEVAMARTHEDSVQQAGRRIRASTIRMSRLFDHLLNLSRVGSEVHDLACRSGNLRDAVTAVVADAQRARPDARFEVSEEGDFNGSFDPDLVARSVRNLVTTALEHAANGEAIAIRLDGSHRDRVWLMVSIGAVIPAELQEAMFVPGPSTAGREVPGFGLGLHAIDGFVRAHGGSVVGRSRAPEGTVFELLLPRDAMGTA
jgi:signal transduction histidine kinase